MAVNSFAGENVRIVLLGKAGSGKSACGNRILRNPEAFQSVPSPASVTRVCQRSTTIVHGSRVSVIDTPGIFDTELNEHDLREEIGRCIELSVPGPHAFLLVIRLDARFTEEEKEAIEWIKKNFGEGALLYTIVLFTHADRIGRIAVHDFISHSLDIVSVVSSCGSRYHAFSNHDGADHEEVGQLLQAISEMIEINGGDHYTNEEYQNAQRNLKWQDTKEKIIDTSLGVMTTAGTIAAVAGGAVMGTHAGVVGAVGVAGVGVATAGATMALTSGAGLIRRLIKKRRTNVTT